jgi:hypothetical protein
MNASSSSQAERVISPFLCHSVLFRAIHQDCMMSLYTGKWNLLCCGLSIPTLPHPEIELWGIKRWDQVRSLRGGSWGQSLRERIHSRVNGLMGYLENGSVIKASLALSLVCTLLPCDTLHFLGTLQKLSRKTSLAVASQSWTSQILKPWVE